MPPLEFAPGDILAVLDDGTIASRIIQFGEWLQGRDHHADHCIVVTHQDAAGRWLGIQGEVGGIGICDCTPYLTNPIVRTNHDQPRPDDNGQLASFLASAAKSVGLTYDWVAIGEAILDTVKLYDLSWEIDHIWRWPTQNDRLPGHMICSSLAARLYEMVGWAHPDMGTERVCEPSDWWVWNDRQLWVPGRRSNGSQRSSKSWSWPRFGFRHPPV